MPKPTQLPAWEALQKHYDTVGKSLRLTSLFESDTKRFDEFHSVFTSPTTGKPHILVDYSKNLVTAETMKLLRQLAVEADVAAYAKKMFAGEKINSTEGRSVLHVALRNVSNTPILVDGKDVMPDVNAVLQHLREFSESVRTGMSHCNLCISNFKGNYSCQVYWIAPVPQVVATLPGERAPMWQSAPFHPSQLFQYPTNSLLNSL